MKKIIAVIISLMFFSIGYADKKYQDQADASADIAQKEVILSIEIDGEKAAQIKVTRGTLRLISEILNEYRNLRHESRGMIDRSNLKIQ